MSWRVLWVVKGLGPGGAERLLCAQARLQDQSRFSTACAYVLSDKDHLAEQLEQAGVETVCLSRRRQDGLWPWRLYRLVRTGKWDIIHVHSPLPGSVARLAARTLPARRRPAVVSTEHNRWSTYRWATRLLNEVTSRWDTATLAVSAEVRESLRGPARRRAEALIHGIDLSEVEARRGERRKIRRELVLTEEEFVVGTVANFRPQKDYPNLLSAMRLLVDRRAPVRLVVVGQGPDEDVIRRLSADLGLDGQVIFTGFREDATAVMAACDAFVLASQWEGLPVAIMEAAALGMPIVATAVGGVAEEFLAGRNALLVPPKNHTELADAIEELATNPDRRDVLGRAAREVAERFDVRRSVQRIEHVYVEAVGDTSIGHGDETPSRHGNFESPTRRASTGNDVSLRIATDEDRPQILDLCRLTLGWGTDPRFERLFQWKHDLNPFGPSLLLVAEDGDRIVGLRAFMRWNFTRGGRLIRAVRAVDTVTHGDFQGRGIFTRLTTRGLETLRDERIEFVFNTPNAQSRPGYLKMGWRDVGRLPVALRVVGPRGLTHLGSARGAASHWSVPTAVGAEPATVLDEIIAARDGMAPVNPTDRTMRTLTTNEFLQWRYAQDFMEFRAIRSGDGVVLVQFRRRGETLECLVGDSFGLGAELRDRAAIEAARDAEADYVVRTGAPQWSLGFVPAPTIGPRLTWRGVEARAMPPLANWDLSLGTVALF